MSFVRLNIGFLCLFFAFAAVGAKEKMSCSVALRQFYESLDVETLVGSPAHVGYLMGPLYTPVEQRTHKTAEGVVVREYQAGADVFDPASGEIHRVHNSEVDIEYFRCGHSDCLWQSVWNDVPKLKETLEATPDAFGVVYISDHHGRHSYAGDISWVKKGYNELVQVKDTSGEIHLFDPRYFFIEFYITDGAQLDKATYAKFPNSKVASYPLLDPAFNSRMAMIDELTRKGKYFEDPKLYEYLEGHLAESIAMIQRSYPKNWQLIESIETQVGKRYLVLLTDPGIASRVGDFTDFAGTHVKKHPAVTPAELREAFSKQLGTRKIYYASFFDAQELASIPTNGVKAGPLNTNENTARIAVAGIFDPYNSYPDQPWAKNLGDDLFAHRIQWGSPSFMTENPTRPLPLEIQPENRLTLHCSAYSHVATAFGYYGPNGIEYADNAQKTFALVEAEVPALSLMKAEGPFVDYKHGPSEVVLEFAGRTISLQNNLNAEVFVPFSIPPSAIRSVKPFDSPPPKPNLVATP